MGYRPAAGLRFLVPVIGVRIPLLQSMERAARIHNAICSTKNYSIYCSLTGWTAPPPPASRKKCAISVRTSDFCWKAWLGGARQLGFCRARASVYPAKRESRTEMAHFFPAGSPRAEREGGPVRFAPSVCFAGRPQTAINRRVFGWVCAEVGPSSPAASCVAFRNIISCFLLDA